MDESTKQHIEEIKTPLPTKPKVAKKYDYEYKRNGGSLLFMFFAPEHSLRKVIIDDRKRAIQWVGHIKTLADEVFPNMKKIHIVLDNYNTHNPKNFYEHFEPEVANRLTKKFVFHFTPKHASWLNMAEIELSDARLKLKKLYPTIEEK